jgi:type IV pilus assembly protein PilA
MAGVNAAATAWNAAFTPTKYVQNMVIAAATGVITITFTANAGPIAGQTIVLTPSINNNPLVAGATGNIDWSCGSTTTATATARGLPVGGGTVNARFVPTECK